MKSARDVLASKQNKVGVTIVSQYDYTANDVIHDRFYRLYVSANHGSATGLQIAEFGLMGR